MNSFGEFVEVWPAHRSETLPRDAHEDPADGSGTAPVDAAIPPTIAALDYSPSLRTVGTCEAALIAVAQADTGAAGAPAAVLRFMIRCESIASSRIDGIGVSPTEYAKAEAGLGDDENATRAVRAGEALDALLRSIDSDGVFTVDRIRSAHAVLLAGAEEGAFVAGQVRDTQTWIGSAGTPRDAAYMPPTAARVPALLADLVAYLNRDDVPVIVQAAIGHAQFLSIRPFVRGNGRIGRALLGASLRRRGVSSHALVPVTCGLLARPAEYLESLVAYRDGDPSPIIVLVANCARVAATESRVGAVRVKELPETWGAAAKPRRGSAAAALIPAFAEHPAMGAAEVERFSGAGRAQAYQAVERLEAAGVIREVTARKRGRVWVATDVLTELDDLDRRIQERMRAGR